jgi:hypothetical protein
MGHYLRAALVALEGCRRGDPLPDVRQACLPHVRKVFELVPGFSVDLGLSPKVRALLTK